MKRILFVQHAGALGGSAMSLLYTLRALDPTRYEPVVALIRPTPELLDLYGNAGFATVAWPGISTFEHTTAGHLAPWRPLDVARGLRFSLDLGSTLARTRELVAHFRPDLVHLNSAVLSPAAYALRGSSVPVVWHVREHPVGHRRSVRRTILRKAMRDWADEVIFISEADRAEWVNGRHGEVIYNFIDFNLFSREIDGGSMRTELGVAQDVPVVLFLGGLSEIKGVFPMLKALARLREDHPSALCLMPGGAAAASGRFVSKVARRLLPLVGSGTQAQRVDAEIARLGLGSACIRLPFDKDVARLIAAADVLAFPSIEPHFARPVIEAAAMGKPVVASRLGGVEELIEDGVTGYLTEPGDVTGIAATLARVLGDREAAARMGEAGYARAKRRFDASTQINRIQAIYERLTD